jgi:type IV fimbrial biogenesis protein FimT
MKSRGFTLLELMVTLAVMSVLFGIGIPSFSVMLKTNAVNTERDNLFNSLVYARTEAIKRGETITICKSINLATCDTSTSWTTGWIIFEDTNGNGVLLNETIMRVEEPLKREILLSFDNGNFVTFDGLGKASDTNGTFSFTHSSGDTNYNRTITLSTTGRSRKAS